MAVTARVELRTLAVAIVIAAAIRDATAQEIRVSCGQYERRDLAAGAFGAFIFDAKEGDVISISIAYIGGSNFSPTGELFGPTPNPDPIVPAFSGVNQIMCPEDGTYRLLVQDSQGADAGTYAVQVHWLHAESARCGKVLECGEIVTQTLAAGAQDAFRFSATKGDIVSLTMANLGGINFSPRLDVFPPDPTIGLPSTDPLFMDLSQVNTVELPETGEYVLRVRDSDLRWEGTYGVQVQSLNPVVRQCAERLLCGEQVERDLPRGAQQCFSIVAKANDLISISLQTVRGSNFSSKADLFGPGPSIEPISPNLQGNQRITLPDRGTYVLRVIDTNLRDAGTFSLQYVWINRSCCDFSAGQVPGDCNKDCSVDMSDAICLLGFLFLGNPAQLPCGDGSVTTPSNVKLLDWNGDRRVDMSDTVGLLSNLFLGGPQHAEGTEALQIEDCALVR